MKNKEINDQATVQTAQLIKAIRGFIAKGRHGQKGYINLLAVGEMAGIQNLGVVLSRPGISVRTVLRVVIALKRLTAHDEKIGAELIETIKDAIV